MTDHSNQQSLVIAPTEVEKPVYLRIGLKLCSFLAYACAAVKYSLKVIGFIKPPSYFSNCEGTTFEIFYGILYARIARRMLSVLVRTPLRKSTLKLINFTIPIPHDSGCIIAICHTPWKRILVQWCVENNFAIIIGGGKWSHQKKLIQRQGAGITELRSIVKYLQLKGRVILAADVFNGLCNCPVKFLENEYNASSTCVRLAIMAKVPIITVIPTLSKTSINFSIGPQFDCSNLRTDPDKTIREILSFLEREIKHNPTIWSAYVK